MTTRSRAITGMPLLAEGASVTLLGSIAAQMAIETFSVYNATKAALRATELIVDGGMSHICSL
jgi:NADP-dependent 3-hydroxy acid dehydrogenase YdfG